MDKISCEATVKKTGKPCKCIARYTDGEGRNVCGRHKKRPSKKFMGGDKGKIPKMGQKIQGLELVRKLGSGAFTAVYEGRYKGMRVAAKCLVLSERKRIAPDYMGHYFCLLRVSEVVKGVFPTNVKGIPWIFPRELENDLFRFTVMQYVGPSLLSMLSKPLKPHKIAKIAQQLIKVLERLHKKGWIHLDIKPANICFNEEEQQFYLVDFGMAESLFYPIKPFGRFPKKLSRRKDPQEGTLRYASLGLHTLETGRDEYDDLEILGYMILELEGVKLWSGSADPEEVFELKKKFRKEVLRDYFIEIFRVDRPLIPRYDYLVSLFP